MELQVKTLEGKAAGSLWMYPWRVDPRESGLELHLPLKWTPGGNDLVCDAPLRVGGVDFKSRGLLLNDWGDWTLAFRLPAADDRYLDVTVGEGMPVVWVESHGIELTVDAGRDAKYEASGDCVLLISAAGRLYGHRSRCSFDDYCHHGAGADPHRAQPR